MADRKWWQRREPEAPVVSAAAAFVRLTDTITLSIYGGPVRALNLVPVDAEGIPAEIGARITFEVVGIERLVVEGRNT